VCQKGLLAAVRGMPPVKKKKERKVGEKAGVGKNSTSLVVSVNPGVKSPVEACEGLIKGFKQKSVGKGNP